MILQPKYTKFKKIQKGRNRGLSFDCFLRFGCFGIKAVSRGRLTSKSIESARRALSHATKRQGKIWIRIFPDKPITEKPLEVRMGKGKGNVEYWVALVQPGKILYEMNGIPEDVAERACKLASAKLSVKTIFVKLKEKN